MFDPKTHCVVVVGAQWGDEGKGKLVDVLSERADCVVRYQGGANAGHTVVIGEEQFILQQIPSGILHAGARCLIGNGVVLDPETLFKELDGLTGRGVDTTGRLFISERAHLVLPYHKLLDAASEKSQKIGTTGRGIGPTYEDKYGRRGVRVIDLRDGAGLRALAHEAPGAGQPAPGHDGGRPGVAGRAYRPAGAAGAPPAAPGHRHRPPGAPGAALRAACPPRGRPGGACSTWTTAPIRT